MNAIKQDHNQWFQLASALNNLADSQFAQLLQQPLTKEYRHRTLLFIRGRKSFESAIYLVELGQVQDAKTIARSLLETLFTLGAITKDPSNIDAIIEHGKSSLLKTSRGTRNYLNKVDPDKTNIRYSNIHKNIEDIEDYYSGSKDTTVHKIAEKSGMIDLYNVFYRGLSNDAAHPATSALQRYTVQDKSGGIIGFTTEPSSSEIEDTLSISCTIMIHLLFCINDISLTEEISFMQNECMDLIQELQK